MKSLANLLEALSLVALPESSSSRKSLRMALRMMRSASDSN